MLGSYEVRIHYLQGSKEMAMGFSAGITAMEAHSMLVIDQASCPLALFNDPNPICMQRHTCVSVLLTQPGIGAGGPRGRRSHALLGGVLLCDAPPPRG